MSVLATYLRAQLEQRGWTQDRLATESGISPSSLSKILSGHSKTPELATLAQLSQALEVPLRTLVEAAGFTIEDGPHSDPDAQKRRVELLLEAAPSLHPLVDRLASLSVEDQQTVWAMVDMLAERRKVKKSKK